MNKSGILSHEYVNASDDPALYAADQCNRQAVTVEWAYDHLVDENVYIYRSEYADLGLDPWISVDGGIQFVWGSNAGKYVLCHGRTGELIPFVDGQFRVFASKNSVARAL
jgi:hypothetical protein